MHVGKKDCDLSSWSFGVQVQLFSSSLVSKENLQYQWIPSQLTLAWFTRANFLWQVLSDHFCLLVYMRKFYMQRTLCESCIRWKTGAPVFTVQKKKDISHAKVCSCARLVTEKLLSDSEVGSAFQAPLLKNKMACRRPVLPRMEPTRLLSIFSCLFFHP